MRAKRSTVVIAFWSFRKGTAPMTALRSRSKAASVFCGRIWLSRPYPFASEDWARSKRDTADGFERDRFRSPLAKFFLWIHHKRQAPQQNVYGAAFLVSFSRWANPNHI